MFLFVKNIVFLSLIVYGFVDTVQAQKIDVKDYKNKAQAYAILSAQYSKGAYFYSRQNFFLTSIKRIKANSDTAIVYTQIAIEYADSAFLIAHDTSMYAKRVLLEAKKYQQKAIHYFQQINKEDIRGVVHDLTEKSMYAMGNAVTDAYEASLFFKQKKEQEEQEKEEEQEEKRRKLTRLEMDEFSFMTIKEIYGQRLIDIEDEIIQLEEEAKSSRGDHLNKINDAIAQLKEEEKDLFEKMKNTEDQLVSVRNDLSEEMLRIVNKDFFSTEKPDLSDEKKPGSTDSEMSEGLIYKVQIGFFKKQLSEMHFDVTFSISSEKTDNEYYRYTAGRFKNYEEAKNAKRAIIEKGYSGFVVAYIDGKKVSIKEALEREKN